MKVLERGQNPNDPNKLFNARGHGCKSLIEFARVESKVTYDQRDGDFMTVTCPVCAIPIHAAIK